MSTIEHAKRELTLAGLFDKDSDYNGELGKAVMELCEVFSKQGHSGGSAHRVISLFKEVASHNCLMPLMGEDSEWIDVANGMLQNNRVSSVFKEVESGRAYYLDAITWRTQTGSTWSGSAQMPDGTKVRSRQYIKAFPFHPKDFVLDVIENEVKPDDWEFTIKDPTKLLEVGKYYDLEQGLLTQTK